MRVSDERLIELSNRSNLMLNCPCCEAELTLKGTVICDLASDLQDAREEIERLSLEIESMRDPDYWYSDQTTQSPFRNKRKFVARLVKEE